MSELKAHNINDLSLHDIANCDFYLKSEADKVIAELKCQVNGFKNRSNLWHYNAVEEHKKFVQIDLKITELKEKHKTEVKELLCLIRDKDNNFNRAFDREEKELRYQKYKRCMAMHDYCLCELEFSFRDPCIEQSTEGCVRWRKWANLWLELAEKFKEVK